MKKFIALVLVMVLPLAGCASMASKKQVDRLDKRVNKIETRQDALEGMVDQDSEKSVYRASDKATPSSSSANLSKKDIQVALKNAGYYYGNIDGKLGPVSRKAIREFQTDHDLKVDGIAGTQTQKALRKYLN